MSDWKHITMFDGPYSLDKQAEGIAIHQAIIGGYCDSCPFLPQCSADGHFIFPVSAWCMRRKAQILADFQGQD